MASLFKVSHREINGMSVNFVASSGLYSCQMPCFSINFIPDRLTETLLYYIWRSKIGLNLTVFWLFLTTEYLKLVESSQTRCEMCIQSA